MADDVSKNTVMILLVLTILVSILGTWTVLEGIVNTRSAATQIQQAESNIASAQVSLTITEPPKPAAATGMVVFNIQNPSEAQ